MIEYLIIAVLVIWSAWVVFRKVFPKTSTALFMSLSDQCQQRGWHALAIRLKPKMVAGCGGSCGCSTDDKPTSPVQEIKPVKWLQ